MSDQLHHHMMHYAALAGTLTGELKVIRTYLQIFQDMSHPKSDMIQKIIEMIDDRLAQPTAFLADVKKEEVA